MNIARKILPTLLLLALCLSACAKPADRMSDRELIRRMIDTYSTRSSAQEEIDSLLAQLVKQNPQSGADWKYIMAYWDQVNTMPISYDVPENLDGSSLCIIVLGFQLEPDGTMREELIGRLQTAMRCARQYPDAYILCTGGGTASANPDVTEAGSMAAWLIDQGIDASRVIVEDQSVNTAENAQFSHAILADQYPEITSLLIATSDYHIPWASILFEAQAVLLGEGHPHILGHTALQTDVTNHYMSYQAAQLRALAGLS